MFSKYKKFLEPLLSIIASPFLTWNPSVLTLLSVLSSILFFFGIVEHLYILSIVSIVGFIFDGIDGHVARKQGKVTPFGGFLDSFCDRVSDFFFITAFGFGHLVAWELVIIVLFTSILISYMRSRGDLAFGLGHKEVPGLMQRTERTAVLYLGFILFLLYPTFSFSGLSFLSCIFIIIVILNSVTILQRFLYFSYK